MKAAVQRRGAAPHGPDEHAFVFTLFLFVGARNGCITMRLFAENGGRNQRAVGRVGRRRGRLFVRSVGRGARLPEFTCSFCSRQLTGCADDDDDVD